MNGNFFLSNTPPEPDQRDAVEERRAKRGSRQWGLTPPREWAYGPLKVEGGGRRTRGHRREQPRMAIPARCRSLARLSGVFVGAPRRKARGHQRVSYALALMSRKRSGGAGGRLWQAWGTLRVALYHRVSTRDQNPTLARGELRAAAARLGAVVVVDVEETASGRTATRPGLQRVLGADVDAVLIWKLDRFGRSVLDFLANVRALRTRGVELIAITQGLRIGPKGDAVSELTMTVLMAFAEFERELTSERTRAGLAEATARGVRLGRPPKKLPSAKRVAALRKTLSWRQVADELGCTVWAARSAMRQNGRREA